MNGTPRPRTGITSAAADARHDEFLWANGYDTDPSARHLEDIRTAHYAGLHDGMPCAQCTKCTRKHTGSDV